MRYSATVRVTLDIEVPIAGKTLVEAATAASALKFADLGIKVKPGALVNSSDIEVTWLSQQ